ncbi:glycosyl transferase [Cupriavidus necator]|uniref:Glycosyl transferase n=1 Tax=Cupriavidus necator TaxID=106590 RepID=A0A1U9URQ2_CUPNE|nr:glycosyltransferase family 2 protein [Cupriavidus necator]AQV95290.1 glycosyl transferase [Cupriavidus necator]
MQNATASIVLYNNPLEQVEACLDSLQACSHVHVILVDNSVQRNRYDQLRSSNVEIINSPGNIGFGRGHNLALPRIRELGSRVHLVVNPDIVVRPGCVNALVQVMASRPDVTVAGPRIVSPEGELYRSCKLFPTPWNLFARRFVPAFLSRRSDARYELEGFKYDHPMEAASLSGAFLAFRTESFLALNGFDPRYFMYLEDVDICRRAARLGVLAFEPKAEVVHEHGQGSYRSFRLLKEHVRSATLYFNRFGWWCDRERDAINRAMLGRVTSGATRYKR